MVGAQDLMRKHTIVALFCLTLMSVGGCQDSGCGSGASTGQSAIVQYLKAVEQEDDEQQCRYLADGEEAAAGRAWASDFIQSIEPSTTIDSLEISELTTEQLGAAHLYTIRAEGKQIAQVTAIERDERFGIAPSNSSIEDE